MNGRNLYTVIFETQDKRVFEVKVRADGFSDSGDMIVFWKRAGLTRKTVHMIAKDLFVSALGEYDNQ